MSNMWSETKREAAELLVKQCRLKAKKGETYGLKYNTPPKTITRQLRHLPLPSGELYKLVFRRGSVAEFCHHIQFSLKTNSSGIYYKAIVAKKVEYEMVIHPWDRDYFSSDTK